jgi:hypothetical protein
MRRLLELLRKCFSFNMEERLPLLTSRVSRLQKNRSTDEQVSFAHKQTTTPPSVFSLLRERLLSLQYAVAYIARKNAWPVPTGIQMLARSLECVSEVSEDQLPEIFAHVKTIIADRIKLSYLKRDPLTYLFYQRTYYDWLEPLASAAEVEQLNKQLVILNGQWLRRCRATQDALVALYEFLLNIRHMAQSTVFQKAGHRFGFLGEKRPEGLERLQCYLQRLPERLSGDQQILLLKQFMQLRRLFAEKCATKNRSFRESRVNLFYQAQHLAIQTIFNSLSEIDQYLLLAIDLDDNTPLARDFLPTPLSLLVDPEKLILILNAMQRCPAQNESYYITNHFSSVDKDPDCTANLGNVPQSNVANVSLACAAK